MFHAPVMAYLAPKIPQAILSRQSAANPLFFQRPTVIVIEKRFLLLTVCLMFGVMPDLLLTVVQRQAFN